MASKMKKKGRPRGITKAKICISVDKRLKHEVLNSKKGVISKVCNDALARYYLKKYKTKTCKS